MLFQDARDSKDPHYVDLVRTADLTRDKCWLDEKGQFHLRIRALLPVDDDKIVQTTKGLDLSQDALLSGKMLKKEDWFVTVKSSSPSQ